MVETKSEQAMLKEFAEFIDAKPTAPGGPADEAILRMVGKDLRPALWKVYTKFTIIEVAAGLLTLTICPQFGLGFSRHNEFLHALHLATPPVVFYLLCGLFFVIFGAALGGLVLTRDEIRSFFNNDNLYFAVYSILAYLTLVALGFEVFVLSSLTWMLGAILGNLLGFRAVIRLRQVTI
ncbi:MAG: hypothetical protein CVU71_14545 [Deltaproteobacteria bacterium HGW-Deltaproteobacteria-6]|jgi:hypothetical protein|nr:MAG: hypothetical protein CVU71_14545 [Deltaproteobacteria bacterium HGW-Deltaproteobacteria-6]